MSCTSCYSQPALSSVSCGVDPCFAKKTTTDLVFYTGDNLPCSTINKCDNLTLALQKIDVKLCPDAIATAIITAIQNNPSLAVIFCNIINGCASTTTTSTSTTAAPTCMIFSLNGGLSGSRSFSFTECGQTQSMSVTVPAGQSVQYCIQLPYSALGATPLGTSCSPGQTIQE